MYKEQLKYETMDVSIICDKRFSMIIWTNHETQYLENQIIFVFHVKGDRSFAKLFDKY